MIERNALERQRSGEVQAVAVEVEANKLHPGSGSPGFGKAWDRIFTALPPRTPERTMTLRSGTVGEPREVGLALLFVGVTALLGLLAAVEEEVSVVGELLDAGVAVLVGVEARFQETQRERRAIQHLAAPADGLVLERDERHDRVDKAHLYGLLGGGHPVE